MNNKEKLSRDSLGIMIKKARENKNLQIEDIISKFNNQKINKKTISNWESGYNFPNLDEIYRLAEILDLNPNEMLELREKIEKSGVKIPNFALRRLVNKILNFAEPGFHVVTTIIKILAVIVVVLLFKYIHSSYDIMEAPLVHEVEDTLDYYNNSTYANEI